MGHLVNPVDLPVMGELDYRFDTIGHEKTWMEFFVPFMLGAATASLFWLAIQTKKQLSSLAAALDDENISWTDPWYQTVGDLRSRIEGFEEELRSCIGEMPNKFSRKGHWPWETIRQSIVRSVTVAESQRCQQHGVDGEADNNESCNDTNKDPESDAQTSAQEKGLCIGSIFGLDVGGTLAKLVYFEQRNPDYDPVMARDRRSRYYSAASSTQADPTNPNCPRIRRRRSISLGHMGRARQLDQDNQDQQQHVRFDEQSLYIQHSHHSQASNEDLRRLYQLRQESVPVDLEQYHTKFDMGELVDPQSEPNVLNPNMQDDNNETDGDLHNMKKSCSMFDLSQLRDRAEALDRFYNFARRLDSYDEGVKDTQLSFYSRELGGDFHFIRFETRFMQNAMDLIRVNDLHLNICEMGATGGGAHKFADAWERQLGIHVDKKAELESLVAGMQFVLSTVVGECYTFRPKRTSSNKHKGTRSHEPQPQSPSLVTRSDSECSSDDGVGAELDSSESEDESTTSSHSSSHRSPTSYLNSAQWWLSKKVQRDSVSYSSTYPYLLISIGTGVSILRVDGPRAHERVSGSTIGGGTYWGLMRLLTDAEDFEDVLELAERGDPSKVDMMVGDIYGRNSAALEKVGLPANVVASSFGKLVAKEDPAQGLKQEDLARALLLMVTNNIGQVAYLNAQLHKTSRIYFVGNFLRGNSISQKRLSYAISYWSKGEMEALFLEHEGYFGALGSFLLSQNISHGEQGFFQWDSQPKAEEDASTDVPSDGTPNPPGFHRRSTTLVT